MLERLGWVLLGVVLLVIFASIMPLLFIEALNTLFGLDIQFNPKTFIASYILFLLIRIITTRKK